MVGPVIAIDDEWYDLEKWANTHPGGKSDRYRQRNHQPSFSV